MVISSLLPVENLEQVVASTPSSSTGGLSFAQSIDTWRTAYARFISYTLPLKDEKTVSVWTQLTSLFVSKRETHWLAQIESIEKARLISSTRTTVVQNADNPSHGLAAGA